MLLGLTTADPPNVIVQPAATRGTNRIFVDRASKREIDGIQDGTLACAVVPSKDRKARRQFEPLSIFEATKS